MSSSVRGRGGLVTMYLKHCCRVRARFEDLFACTYVQTLVELLLLLVYYTQAEVDFVCLLEVGLHAHNLGESLFGVLKGAIAVVQNTNAVPKFGFLRSCYLTVPRLRS